MDLYPRYWNSRNNCRCIISLCYSIKSHIQERKFLDEARKDLDDFEEHIDEIPI